MRQAADFLNSLPAAALLLVLTLAALIGVIVTVSPLSAGPAGAMAVFLLMYLCFFALFLVGAHIYFLLRYRQDAPDEQHAPQRPAPSSRVVAATATWAIAPIIILALSSLQQLDTVSVILLIVFEILASVYVFRR